MRFKPGSTWQSDQQSRLVPGNTASMKQQQQQEQQRCGGTVGDAQDVQECHTKQTNYAHLCRVPNEPTIIGRPRGHVWTHGLAPLLFAHPLLFEEDYSAGTSVRVDWGPWRTSQTVVCLAQFTYTIIHLTVNCLMVPNKKIPKKNESVVFEAAKAGDRHSKNTRTEKTLNVEMGPPPETGMRNRNKNAARHRAINSSICITLILFHCFVVELPHYPAEEFLTKMGSIRTGWYAVWAHWPRAATVLDHFRILD